MPKDIAPAPSTPRFPSASDTVNSLARYHANALQRNKACHQCRKRKVKCDAKQPCSTCSRSHAHAVKHAPPGAHFPPHPECTYDDEPATSSSDAPKSRTERLAERVRELEALLRQKESGGATGIQGSSMSPFTENAAFITAPTNSTSEPSASRGPPNVTANTNWPSGLPSLDLLRHLVEAFFTFQPHAGHLIHAPTFLSSLDLPPSHPKFPLPSLLHSICAVASNYTALVSSPPLQDFDKIPLTELWPHNMRKAEDRPDSFAEEQAKAAVAALDDAKRKGEKLIQCVQTQICLNWYYWCHSKWVQLFTSSAMTVQGCVPLSLNVCAPFHSLTKSRGPTVIPPARSPSEDETRRNVFWVAYAQERMHNAGNWWALTLDDYDVAQLLPVRKDQFNLGILVTPEQRQWSYSKNVLLEHPEDATDSFILYIKAAMLVSRVNSFNTRFRSRFQAGDPAFTPLGGGSRPEARETPAFLELDHIAAVFHASFPAHLKEPVVGNVVDVQLYTACLIPHVVTILLHEPHANVRRSGCVSALRILTAARSVLDMIYLLWSTSFDITLLDYFCTFGFYRAGRVLLSFLKTAIDTHSQTEISTFRTELEYIRSAISKIGERVPLGFRYARLLEDATVEACGPFSLLPSTQRGPSGFHP